MDKLSFIQIKQNRRQQKRAQKRAVTCDEVLFIFEKVLEGWPTIKIYNTLIQTNPTSYITKKNTETIATGNCKLYPSELTVEQYTYYTLLREKVYAYHSGRL